MGAYEIIKNQANKKPNKKQQKQRMANSMWGRGEGGDRNGG